MPDLSRRSLLKLAGFGAAAGASALQAGALAHQDHADHPDTPPAHGVHSMGAVGRVSTERFDPGAYLKSFNGSHLPAQERARFYTETPRPDGSLLREYRITAVDRELEIAPGIFFPAWTYNGQVPGPTLRATEGDRVRVTFVNQ